MTGFRDDFISTSSIKVLVIDDDDDFCQSVVEALEKSGIQTARASNGADGLALKRRFEPNIVLVDPNLPDTDGLGLVVHLVHQDDCGIIIVSGLTDEADRIVGLEIGADDYVCKPFCQRELLARIRAVRRRVEMRAAVRADPAARSIIQFGKLKIDLKGRTVHAANGQPIRLTAAEFMVLKTMLAANGKAVSRDCLSEAALHHPWHSEDRSVDQLIFNLRQKLADGDEQPFIHSIRGAGYLLSVQKIEVVAKSVPIDQLVTPGVSTPIVGLFMPMVAHLSPIATAVPLLSNPL